MLWVIYCSSNVNSDALRDKVRPLHSDYLRSQENIILLAGPMQSDDGTAIIGNLFVVNVQSRDEAQAFSEGEPFTQAGVFASVTITRIVRGI